MLTATRKLFVPNAVFIPTKDGKEGRDFDRDDCTLLFVDGEFSHGEVYTEEAWKTTANRPTCSSVAILPARWIRTSGRQGPTSARRLHRQDS